MKKLLPWIFGSIGIFLIIVAIIFMGHESFTQHCVARIDISGPIMEEGVPSSLIEKGKPGAVDIVRAIKEADENDKYSAILLVVNSPGGEVVASNEIYRAVKEAHKPVVVYIKGMGTSGAYYLSLAADRIVAHPDALTGSIGVRLSVINYYGLMEKLGIKEYTYAKGHLKDMLSPFKPNYTEEEEEVVNSIIDQIYTEFVNKVKEHRPGVDPTAFSSRIFSGKQAYQHGLVDDVGTLDDAIALAARLGGLDSNDVCVIDVESTGSYPLGSKVSLEYRCC